MCFHWQSGSESVEVSVVQSSLADGDWHSLTVVVSGNTASFYQDAALIDSRYMCVYEPCTFLCDYLSCTYAYSVYVRLTTHYWHFSVSHLTGHWKSHLLEMKLECWRLEVSEVLLIDSLQEYCRMWECMLPHSVRGQGLLEFPQKFCHPWHVLCVLHYIHFPSLSLSLCSQISAIATDTVASSLSPISGSLSYYDGATERGITISTVDDLIPEPSTVFSLQLTSSNGGSRISSTASIASVTGKQTNMHVHTQTIAFENAN